VETTIAPLLVDARWQVLPVGVIGLRENGSRATRRKQMFLPGRNFQDLPPKSQAVSTRDCEGFLPDTSAARLTVLSDNRRVSPIFAQERP